MPPSRRSNDRRRDRRSVRPALAFVESNTSGTGRLFVRAARRMGFHPVVFASDPSRWDTLAAEDAELRQIATSDGRALLEACQALRSQTGLAGVTSSSEYYIGTAAALAAQLGLPGPSAAAIAACRDKAAQRLRLHEAGVATPRFAAVRVDAPADAVAAGERLGFPVVLKPVSGSGSVGVRICTDAADARAHMAALVNLAEENGGRYGVAVLVEAFVDGPEYSVEIFHGEVVGVTAKHVSAPPHAVEVGHDYPAALSPGDAAAIGGTALQAIRALGLHWGPAHVEVRVGRDGPRLIEVNPRLAGGFIPELVRHATGIDLIAATTAAASGAAVMLRAASDRAASIRFLLLPGDGTLAGLRRIAGADAERDARVVEVRQYAEAGAALRVRGDFRDRIGHVIAVADNLPAARAVAEREHSQLRVEMHAPSAAA